MCKNGRNKKLEGPKGEKADRVGGAQSAPYRFRRSMPYFLIAAVTVDEREDGSLDIILNGRTMVTRDAVQQFTTDYRETSSGYEMVVLTEGHFADVNLPEGRLRGLLQRQVDTPHAALAAAMPRLPQTLLNVRVERGFDVDASTTVRSVVDRVESDLNGRGRVVLRASGTEPVVRVMVEGDQAEVVANLGGGPAEAEKRERAGLGDACKINPVVTAVAVDGVTVPPG